VVQIPNSLKSLFGKEGLREFEARGLKKKALCLPTPQERMNHEKTA
jgi:hypothetical protein